MAIVMMVAVFYAASGFGGRGATVTAMTVIPTIVADRLYGISIRPQELAVYGEAVRFELRFGVTNEDPEAEVTTHFKLLVLEISCEVPADAELQLPSRHLELVKCGWELELQTASAVKPAALADAPHELDHALERIADTVNELARRAGLEAPMGPDLVSDLLAQYRE